MSKDQAIEKGKDACKSLTDFVNGANTIHRQGFVDQMMIEHRTLQQESFDLFVKWVGELAKLNENRYDARNKYAVETSKRIMDEVFGDTIDIHSENIVLPLDTEIKIGTTFVTYFDSVEGSRQQLWEFTKIKRVRVMESNGEASIVVDGRAKRI